MSQRFSGHASDEDLKIATPTSKMCLSFNFFNNKGVEFVDCEKRIPFICEKVTDFAEDHSVTWSPWINVGKAGYGDVESLGVTVNTYNKGTLVNEIKCFNPMVKSHCEKQNRKCQDKVYGPQCVAVRPVKTGKEVIGTGTCTQDGVKYDMHQCAARGDPHYITLDSLKYDFQGKCSYTLVQICNSFTKSDRFPTFRIISSNDRRRPSDQVSFTRGFELSVRGIRYTFRRGTFKVNVSGWLSWSF
ncbi:IgGFc-binding protein [Aplysia californica]|uniref:IgGFc-binding protein n=1 Tax=Aplysia californica TaxID=6500 RepID=A0ABM1VX27_APLCA|nr:IgGFc-binding protein [Aplysia californica]